MNLHLEIPSEHPLAGLLAEAQLAERYADFYDMLAREVRRELVETHRSRVSAEALIDRLIQGLDEIDAEHEDREPYLAGTGGRDGDDREGERGWDSDFEPDQDGERDLGWTDREAQTGRYPKGSDYEDEPTLGAHESASSSSTRYALPGTRGRFGSRTVAGQEHWADGANALTLDDAEDENEHGGDASDQGESGSWSEAGSLRGYLDAGDEDAELTSCETRGGGFTLNGGAQADDAEDTHDCEQDPAEAGYADRDVDNADESYFPVGSFDGSGRAIAQSLLRAARPKESDVTSLFPRSPGLCRVGNVWLPRS